MRNIDINFPKSYDEIDLGSSDFNEDVYEINDEFHWALNKRNRIYPFEPLNAENVNKKTKDPVLRQLHTTPNQYITKNGKKYIGYYEADGKKNEYSLYFTITPDPKDFTNFQEYKQDMMSHLEKSTLLDKLQRNAIVGSLTSLIAIEHGLKNMGKVGVGTFTLFSLYSLGKHALLHRKLKKIWNEEKNNSTTPSRKRRSRTRKRISKKRRSRKRKVSKKRK